MKEAKILIVGAGPAGFAAAKAAAKRSDGVVLCGSEAYAPYWRTRLPAVIGEETAIENISMVKDGWFEKNNIRFVSKMTMASVDTENNRVFWTDGTYTGYQKLILALGAYSFVPPINYQGEVLCLRDYDDALAIRKKALEKKRSVVIGGGLLGLEIASEIRKLGKPVTVIERDYVLARQLDPLGGEYLAQKLTDDNLKIITGADASDYPELLEDSCVVVAAGVRSNIKVLQNTPIKLQRAVVVNDRMQTSVDNIYACGDIAEYNDKCWGLITIANVQGNVAGSNAAGTDLLYRELLPAPTLKVSGISIMSMGEIYEAKNRKLLRYSDADLYQSFVIENNRLIGAILIGDISLGFKIKKLIEKKVDIPSEITRNELVELIAGL